jgi:hypothetical protein
MHASGRSYIAWGIAAVGRTSCLLLFQLIITSPYTAPPSLLPACLEEGVLLRTEQHRLA